MTSQATLFVEFLFFDVVAVVWAAWEFWAARPRGDAKKAIRADESEPSPERPRHPEG